MTVVLAFVVPLIALALWWLLSQGVTAKPWLETGPETAARAGPGGAADRVGLGVVIVVVGCLFALFGSAFVMRMDAGAWRTLSLPPIVWINTAALILAGLCLHRARAAAERGDARGLRAHAALAALATAGFLCGQLVAWRTLSLGGDGLATGPAASFFFLLSGLHGLHILGGLGALGRVTARGSADLARAARGMALCAAYWDFLLLVWAGLLVLFLGWANRVVDLCRAVLT